MKEKLYDLGTKPVPAWLTERAAATRDLIGSVGVDQVEPYALTGYDILHARSSIDWHDDREPGHVWSLLWIVANDRKSIVEADGVVSGQQPVGTVLLLNIHAEHRLYCKVRSRGITWQAVAIDFPSKPSASRCLKILAELNGE